MTQMTEFVARENIRRFKAQLMVAAAGARENGLSTRSAQANLRIFRASSQDHKGTVTEG
jgi:hypothetical protein